MLNITTFLDANACRLDKNVLYNPKTNEKYNSREILAITSEIARDLKNCSIKKGDRDLMIVPNVRGSSLDPVAQSDGTTTKIGLDATKSLKTLDKFERVSFGE